VKSGGGRTASTLSDDGFVRSNLDLRSTFNVALNQDDLWSGGICYSL
jgi:hypothetical protein